MALYAPVAKNDFVNLDDDVYIVNSGHVRAGLTWETVKWSFTTLEQANWHPLTWLSHALDCQFFGLNPVGHHMIGVLLHAANAVILFFLLQSATGLTWRSLVVAGLFAFHPINVESVAWAAERKNVLSMLFFLLAFVAYGWYVRRPGVRRYSLVFLLYSLALMSKPQVITFPFLLLLWDYWPLGRVAQLPIDGSRADPQDTRKFSAQRLVFEKVPFFLLSAAAAVITVLAQRAGHALRTTSEYGLLNRTENALISYVRYLDLAVWPARLAALYPHPEKLFPPWQVVGATLILILVTAAVFAQRHQRPALLVGWLWFLGSMFPMIGLVQVGGHALADRYAYIPFIGLFVMVVWGVADWAERHRIAPAWMVTATALVLIALAATTHRQIGMWRDSPTLWLRALAVTENNYLAHDTMARMLAEQGREEEAAVHLRAALAIKPNDVVALLNLGNYEYEHGNVPSAIGRFQFVATYAADRDLKGTAYGNLGSVYRQLGDDQEARRCYEESLRLTPGRVTAIVGMGLLAEHDGDFAEAIRRFSNAMALQPNDVGYLLLAGALERAGDVTAAQAARQQASRMSSNLDAAHKAADALIEAK